MNSSAEDEVILMVKSRLDEDVGFINDAGARLRPRWMTGARAESLLYLGSVSKRNDRVLKGPLGRSLRWLARNAHELAHSLHILPRGTVETHEHVSTL